MVEEKEACEVIVEGLMLIMIVMEKVVLDADWKLKNLVLVAQLNKVMQQVTDTSYYYK